MDEPVDDRDRNIVIGKELTPVSKVLVRRQDD